MKTTVLRITERKSVGVEGLRAGKITSEALAGTVLLRTLSRYLPPSGNEIDIRLQMPKSITSTICQFKKEEALGILLSIK